MVSCVGLQCVIVVFPDHTYLLLMDLWFRCKKTETKRKDIQCGSRKSILTKNQEVARPRTSPRLNWYVTCGSYSNSAQKTFHAANMNIKILFKGGRFIDVNVCKFHQSLHYLLRLKQNM